MVDKGLSAFSQIYTKSNIFVMFKREKIDISMINTTSKMSLKMSCTMACNGDVVRAKELYDFLVEGIESIPDFDIPKPSTMQQAQQMVGNIFGWVKNNKDDIVNAIGFIQTLRGGSGGSGASIASGVVDSAIPPIPTK